MRFRFSLRTLAILVTLFCAYLACWLPTKRHAASRMGPWQFVQKATAPLPLLVREDQIHFSSDDFRVRYPRRYYVWLFGPKMELPFKSDWRASQSIFVPLE
jgi:hypothetical protein